MWNWSKRQAGRKEGRECPFDWGFVVLLSIKKIASPSGRSFLMTELSHLIENAFV